MRARQAVAPPIRPQLANGRAEGLSYPAPGPLQLHTHTGAFERQTLGACSVGVQLGVGAHRGL